MTTSTSSSATVQPEPNKAGGVAQQAINVSLSSLAGKLDSLLESYGVANPSKEKAKAEAARPVVSPPAPPVPPAPAPRPLPTAQAPLPTPPVVTVRAVETSPAAKTPNDFEHAKIMIVDDEEANVLTVKHHLSKDGFKQFVFTVDPRESLAMLRSEKPDVLLLDIKMPHVSGIDILRAKGLDQSLPHTPVIILTATVDPLVKRECLDLGAYDFLTKPVDPNDLIPRVRNAVVVKRHFDLIANEATRLEDLVKRRTEELEQSRQQLILSLARAAEHRDNETGNHVIRVGQYAAIIARELGWSDSQTQVLEQAAQLHDVGKIGIPDAILFKPGKLDPQEFDIIKHHCAIGHEIINPYSIQDAQILRSHARVGGNILHLRSSPMLMMASRIAQTHHECWDGTGYPLGLAGEDIPLEGRITSVADVFDALSSRRPYKEPFPREKSFKILSDWRGTKFDPRVLDAFFTRAEEIIEVQLRLMDPAPSVEIENNRATKYGAN